MYVCIMHVCTYAYMLNFSSGLKVIILISLALGSPTTFMWLVQVVLDL